MTAKEAREATNKALEYIKNPPVGHEDEEIKHILKDINEAASSGSDYYMRSIIQRETALNGAITKRLEDLGYTVSTSDSFMTITW